MLCIVLICKSIPSILEACNVLLVTWFSQDISFVVIILQLIYISLSPSNLPVIIQIPPSIPSILEACNVLLVNWFSQDILLTFKVLLIVILQLVILLVVIISPVICISLLLDKNPRILPR